MLRMLGEVFDETHLWDLNSWRSKNLIRSGSLCAYAWGGSVCGITSDKGGTELRSISYFQLKRQDTYTGGRIWLNSLVRE